MHGIHPVFHISMLEPSAPNEFPNRTETPPPPIIIDGETEFEISKILDSKINKCHKCRLQYLVKWSDYEGTDEETSWIPTSELKHTMESMVDFHLANLDKPGVRVPIFPIVVCVRSAYVIGAGVGFRVESGAVALLQLDL